MKFQGLSLIVAYVYGSSYRLVLLRILIKVALGGGVKLPRLYTLEGLNTGLSSITLKLLGIELFGHGQQLLQFPEFT